MPTIRLGLLLLFLFLINKASGQRQDTVYSDLNDALKNPEKVFYLSLDCDDYDDSLFYKNIRRFKNLEVFSISNCRGDNISNKISSLRNLQRLYITSATSEIDFAKLFNYLSTLTSLKTLSINDCGLKTCPKEIQKLKSLQTLIITDNDEFDTKLLIKYISKLPKLQKLALPINQITDLPENIGMLTQIEVLDLSNNWLTDLPDEIGEMKNLENLDISGNIIISPLSALDKLKSLNIRTLNMDKGLTDEEKVKLSKLFPNASITEITKDPVADVDSIAANIPVIDTASVAKDSVNEDVAPPNNDTIHYGTFNIQKDQFKILSPAYLYFAKIFNNSLYKNTFDSTLFDERYLDTGYVNVNKRLRNNGGLLALENVKNRQNQIWFTFFPGFINKYFDQNEYLRKWNNELNSFRGMVWVYTGQLTKSEFTKVYLKKWDGNRGFKFWKKGYLKKKQIYWNDVRIYYNETILNFTIELKSNNSYKQITAYPRLTDDKSAPDFWQKQYTKRYAHYLSMLNRRRTSFHKRLMKEKLIYDAARKKSIHDAWAGFQKFYLTEEEKKLSMNEWLQYYDNVIANEKKALLNADASAENMMLYIERENYVPTTFANIIKGDTSLQAINIYFKDEEQSLLPVSKILLLNQSDKTYCQYNGTVGLESMLMYLSTNKPLSIVIELRNGDIGVLTKEKYAREKLKGVTEYTFTVQRLNKKLGSVGQIVEMLNL
jgi:hypothetical protein